MIAGTCCVDLLARKRKARESCNNGNTAPLQLYDKKACKPRAHGVPNPSPSPDKIAPDLYYAILPTTVGGVESSSDENNNRRIVLEVNRTWAPIGADRFYSLVNDGYYDCAALFRVVPGFVLQWGIAAEPEETAKWETEIPDDHVSRTQSNLAGWASFATAGPETRTAQVFVNTVDNPRLDAMGFAPFARVIEGMDTVLTSEDLNIPDPVPNQAIYRDEGNAWILDLYPDIDIILPGGSTTTTLPVAAPIDAAPIHEKDKKRNTDKGEGGV